MDADGVFALEDVLAEGEELAGVGTLFCGDILLNVVLPQTVLEDSEGRLRETGAVHSLGIAQIDVLHAVKANVG